MIISFSFFCRRFHNKTIVFQKNENINIPTSRVGSQNIFDEVLKSSQLCQILKFLL